MKPSQDLAWRDIDGELVVLHLASGAYHTFNEVGRLVWLELAAGEAVDHIADKVAAAYDVETGRAQADIIALLRRLMDTGLLIPDSLKEANDERE